MNLDLKIIDNIKYNLENNLLNETVAIDDPILTEKEIDKLIKNYYKIKENKIKYNIDKKAVDTLVRTTCKYVYDNIEIVGLENLDNINDGAIITGNHYSPVDTIPIKEFIKKKYNKEPYIVSLASNLALKAPLDYIINHQNILPIKDSISYMNEEFKPRLFEYLNNKEYIIIYPEQQMWNNYRLPRPCKRGAYSFAAEANKPIISTFTELIDTGISDDDNFNKIKYRIHILKPIYPDSNKSIRQNSIDMSSIDYEQKIKCYEEVYNTKLDYTFNISNIAGLKKKD